MALGDTKPLRLRPFGVIEDVSAHADGPPRLHLIPKTRRPLIRIVGRSRRLTMLSKDNSTRDEAVAAIRERVGRGGVRHRRSRTRR
jgi:hypothetical protein